jgi:prepilin-type N-terminal cleavage/methylation domain-containing protein
MRTPALHRLRAGFTLIELMIVIAIIAILAAILIPNFIHARSMAQLTGCKSNLKNIATALEAYSVDNGGHYPSSLGLITPNYIKTLPQCPTAASNTYVGSYAFTINPDSYDFYCAGTYHSPMAVPADYPQWHSTSGLQER